MESNLKGVHVTLNWTIRINCCWTSQVSTDGSCTSLLWPWSAKTQETNVQCRFYSLLLRQTISAGFRENSSRCCCCCCSSILSLSAAAVDVASTSWTNTGFYREAARNLAHTSRLFIHEGNWLIMAASDILRRIENTFGWSSVWRTSETEWDK